MKILDDKNSSGFLAKKTMITNSASMLIGMGTIRLDTKDVFVLNSLLTLAPELKEHYTLVPPSRHADAWIFFVNADNELALAEWRAIKKERPTTTAIMVYRQAEPLVAEYSIKLPLLISRLLPILQSILAKKPASVEYLKKQGSEQFGVLVVDDSLSVRKYMEQKLTELSHGKNVAFQYAASGEEAVAKIKGSPSAINLVFLDVMMEDLNGFQVCKWIKSVNKEIAVVMLTNRGSVIDKMRGSMSHCDAYLAKPPLDIELKAILKNVK